MSVADQQQPPPPQQQTQQWIQADGIKFMFSREATAKQFEERYEYIRKNFIKEPAIITNLVDYYFVYGNHSSSPSSVASSSSSSTEAAGKNHYGLCLLNEPSKKNVIDLICSIPEDLCQKLFDRILDFLRQQATLPGSAAASQPLVNLSVSSSLLQQQPPNSANQAHYLNNFEKVTYLLVSICYRNNTWLNKLISHQLFGQLIKNLKMSFLNELITVHASLLFVVLMTNLPNQLFSQYTENLFQVYVNLFKYLSHIESRSHGADELVLKSVRWSVRLCFHVCYGVYASHFVQFLRKKEQQSLNKDYLSSMFFFMRFHPSLLREKTETDKNAKQQDEGAFEWRHYCLDPLFTTYNAQTMENMVKLSSSTHNLQTQLSTPRSNPLNLTGALGSNSSRLFSSLHEALPYYGPSRSQQPYQFQQQSSLNAADQSFSAKYPFSVNLTEQFMRDGQSNTCSVDNTTVVNDQLSSLNVVPFGELSSRMGALSKKKSYSDPNLFASLSMPSSIARVAAPLGNDQMRQLVRSEMRDRNIIDQNLTSTLTTTMTTTTTSTTTATVVSTPLTMSTFSFQPLSQSEQHAAAMANDSVGSNHDTRSSSLSHHQPASSSRQLESYDIVSGYFSNNSSSLNLNDPTNTSSSMTTTTTPSSSATQSSYLRLKQEMDHLVLQLQYERHLREKYEESSNLFYSFKIERDQLQMEKTCLEMNLRDQTDRFKNEIESSLSVQHSLELRAYKEELEKKDEIISDLLEKQRQSELLVSDLRECNEKLRQDYLNAERNYSAVFQKLESEQNLNLKHQVDANYVKSLCQTNELLRKKLIVLTKSLQQLKLQQQMSFAYSQDLTAVPLIFNQIDTMTEGQMGAKVDGVVQGESETSESQQTFSPFIYQFQQNRIESLTQQIESLEATCSSLSNKHNQVAIELDNCKKALKEKDEKLDELNQKIQLDFVDTNAEMMKTHYRAYQSLVNVNKRLEKEISKLRAELDEKKALLDKQSKLIENEKLNNRFIFQRDAVQADQQLQQQS